MSSSNISFPGSKITEMLKKRQLDRRELQLSKAEIDISHAFEKYSIEKSHLLQAQTHLKELQEESRLAHERAFEMQVDLHRKERVLGFEEKAKANLLLRQSIDKSKQVHAQVLMKAKEVELMERLVVDPMHKFTILPHLEATDRQSTNQKVKVWLIGVPKSKHEGHERFGTLYYGVYSDAPSPPTKGWLSCFPASIDPPPRVRKVKTSGVETWEVEGSGCSHVNGKYMHIGFEDEIPKFQSKGGLQLYRSPLRKDESLDIITAGLLDDEREGGQDIDIEEEHSREEQEDKDNQGLTPYEISLLKDDLNYSNVRKVGALLARSTIAQKRDKLIALQDQKEQTSRELVTQQFGESAAEATKPVEEDQLDENMSFQDQTISFNAAYVEPVIQSRMEAATALCHAWVLMQCPAKGLACPRRHYYISRAEASENIIYRRTYQSNLEIHVLRAIAAREHLLVDIKKELALTTNIFQRQHKRLDHDDIRALLELLGALRLATVHVFEKINKWRHYVMHIGRVAIEHGQERATKVKAGWSVSLTLDGKQLYKPSAAFESKIKRFRRPEDPAGKKARIVKYLGLFQTQVDAALAYDRACAAEARRLNIPVAQMPKRRSIFRSCGYHYAIESQDEGPSVCEECASRRSEKMEYTPSYLWNGRNYILKMASDCDFLAKEFVLSSYLGPEFRFQGNPFLLPSSPIQDLSVYQAIGVSSEAKLTLHDSPLASNALGFGYPQLEIQKDASGIIKVAEQTLVEPKIKQMHLQQPSQIVSEPDDEAEYEVLSMDRITEAQKMLLQEEELAGLSSPNSSVSAVAAINGSGALSGKSNDARANTTYRIVQALYWDRCAALAMVQKRKALDFERPEYENMNIPGRHMRRFMFEQELYQKGKDTQKQRRQAIKLLRQVIALDDVQFNLEAARELEARARVLKGDVVLMEADHLAKRIAEWKVRFRCLKKIQRFFRGMQHRTKVTRRKRLLLRAQKLRYARENCIAKVAREHLQMILHRAIKKTTKTLRRPAYVQAKLMDHEATIVGVYSLRHFDYENCSRKPTISQECLACKKALPYLHYSCFHHEYQVAHPPCTCVRPRPVERLLLRVYNPMTSAVYRLVLNSDAIKQRVMQYWHENNLPLNALIPRAVRHEALPTDPVFNLGKPRSLARVRTRWEPVAEAQYAQAIAQTKLIYARYLEQRAKTLQAQAENWRKMAEECEQGKETAKAELENAITKLDEARANVVLTTKKAAETLSFSKRQLEFYSDLSRNSIQQSWDPIENAYDGHTLVDKRKAFVEEKHRVQLYEQCRLAVFQYEHDTPKLKVFAAKAQHRATRAAAKARAARRQANEYVGMASSAQIMMKEVLHLLCNMCTLRWTRGLPLRRNLLLRETHWTANPSSALGVVQGKEFMPLTADGYNVLLMKSMKIHEAPPLRDEPAVPRRKSMSQSIRVLVTVLSDPRHPHDLLIVIYNPATSKYVHLGLNAAIVKKLLCQPEFRYTKWKHLYENEIEEPGLLPNQIYHSRKLEQGKATALVSLLQQDRHSRDFTCKRLHFFRIQQRLLLRFNQCIWYHDILYRKKRSDQGVCIYEGAQYLDATYCIVQVYENWGDFLIQVYNRRTCREARYRLLHSDIIHEIYQELELLRAYVQSVQSCTYSSLVLDQILKRLRWKEPKKAHVLTFHSTTPASSLRVCHSYKQKARVNGDILEYQHVHRVRSKFLLLRIWRTQQQDLIIDAFDFTTNRSYPLTLSCFQLEHLYASSPELLRPLRRPALYRSLIELLELGRSPSATMYKGEQVADILRQHNAWIETTQRYVLLCRDDEAKELKECCSKYGNPMSVVEHNYIEQWRDELNSRSCAQALQALQLQLVQRQHPMQPRTWLYRCHLSFAENPETIEIYGYHSELMVEMRPTTSEELMNSIEARNRRHMKQEQHQITQFNEITRHRHRLREERRWIIEVDKLRQKLLQALTFEQSKLRKQERQEMHNLRREVEQIEEDDDDQDDQVIEEEIQKQKQMLEEEQAQQLQALRLGEFITKLAHLLHISEGSSTSSALIACYSTSKLLQAISQCWNRSEADVIKQLMSWVRSQSLETLARVVLTLALSTDNSEWIIAVFELIKLSFEERFKHLHQQQRTLLLTDTPELLRLPLVADNLWIQSQLPTTAHNIKLASKCQLESMTHFFVVPESIEHSLEEIYISTDQDYAPVFGLMMPKVQTYPSLFGSETIGLGIARDKTARINPRATALAGRVIYQDAIFQCSSQALARLCSDFHRYQGPPEDARGRQKFRTKVLQWKQNQRQLTQSMRLMKRSQEQLKYHAGLFEIDQSFPPKNVTRHVRYTRQQVQLVVELYSPEVGQAEKLMQPFNEPLPASLASLLVQRVYAPKQLELELHDPLNRLLVTRETRTISNQKMSCMVYLHCEPLKLVFVAYAIERSRQYELELSKYNIQHLANSTFPASGQQWRALAKQLVSQLELRRRSGLTKLVFAFQDTGCNHSLMVKRRLAWRHQQEVELESRCAAFEEYQLKLQQACRNARIRKYCVPLMKERHQQKRPIIERQSVWEWQLMMAEDDRSQLLRPVLALSGKEFEGYLKKFRQARKILASLGATASSPSGISDSVPKEESDPLYCPANFSFWDFAWHHHVSSSPYSAENS